MGNVQALGIYLFFSDNNTFSTTTVSNVTATTLNARGISIGFSSDNNSFEIRTAVSNVTANQGATGIDVDSAAKNRFDTT